MSVRAPAAVALLALSVALAPGALADEPQAEAPAEVVDDPSSLVSSSLEPEPATAPDGASAPTAQSAVQPKPTAPAKAAVDPTLPSPPGAQRNQPLALPTGADKSGVTSKTISIPKGAGTIQGMEESFSAQLSTGIATFSVPFALPAARGGAQPSLGLSYSSAGGYGVAGLGWSVGVPFIARQTDRGVPRYDDQGTWHPEQDRFVFNGGQELVPICTVTSGLSCTGALTGEVMPVWATGWQYFRPRVEGSFLRFFWSPDHLTWRVQDKSGVTMELGVPLDGSGYADALERNPDDATEIYRWHLVRQYDTWGNANPPSGNPAPLNVVVFRFQHDGGMAHLSDIFDTPPAGSPTTAPLSAYAHHTRLVYELRTDPTASYRSGWRIDQRLRLARVDVTSKTFDAPAAARRLVRRYHLGYDAASHASSLTSLQVEGRCGAAAGSTAVAETAAPAENANQTLPDSTGCPRLPAMSFGYSHVTPLTTTGAPGIADLSGYEGFDERLTQIQQSPPHSIDEQLTDLFDIDSDGLPDVLVTAAGIYGSDHGVFFNGAGGIADRFGAATEIKVAGVLGGNANVIALDNFNVVPLDLDGDAIVNLLHMPKVKTYALYQPALVPAGWIWQGRAVTTADGLSAKIDFGKDAEDKQVMDVNFDGLVDVVVTTGTEVQTFLSLGRYPGGDGQFGSAKWTGASTAQLSNEPIRTCVPWSGTPVRFSDPDIKLADMNGDGITDIVRIHKGDIRYWPGRGNGFWGTGKRDDCPANTFGQNRHVLMSTSPQYSDIQGDTLRLDDVNGDGLSDLVQVRFTDVDVWLNVDGIGWTDRHVIKGTPASPSYANRVRLVDVNGSGTLDVLWGNGNKYEYMDLAGGARPGVLVRVDNGLGKSTHLEYSTSTAEMLAAEKSSKPWTKRMPSVVHVVKRVTETDNHVIAGRPPAAYVTEYAYRDPVFEARQREFRGFSSATARRIGDSNSPTDITQTTFLLGECADETPANGLDECSLPERWRDNPREALKGLPIVTETRDEEGRTLSTDHTTYRLRRLYTGLDGREVRHAFERARDSFVYDTADFIAAAETLTLDTVEVEHTPAPDGTGPPIASLTVLTPVTLRAKQGRARIQSSSTVDVFGNSTHAVALGCTEGCPAGVDETISTTTTPGRPQGDPTGWLWRTVHSFVEGSSYFLGKLREVTTSYSPEGVPLTTTHKLEHTLPLDRFHASGGAIAPTPNEASQDGNIVWSNQYDAFGNLERETGPNGRCRDLGYDAGFDQLPTKETIFTGGCAVGPLSTDAEYDRGLTQITNALDIQKQPSKVDYDAFGRIVAVTRPHPVLPFVLSPLPSVLIEYFLPPDLGSPSAPVHHSIIHTRTQDGLALTDSEYLESWAYVDGMGRTLVTLSEADPTAGDDAPWIASGQVVFDGKGAVERKHLDAFHIGLPKSFPLAASPTAPFGTQGNDAFGRQRFTTDLDGTVTLHSRYHALTTELWDAADLGPGPHAGTFASETKDGHGRTAITTERFHEGNAVRTRDTRTTFLPTNEPLTITRELAGTSNKVVRWMRYDSLGRMLLNVEPNTTVGFAESHTTNPSTLRAWRYAYNDADDFVATSDARGCGVNFHYDTAGRLLLEDYSPCESGHAPYSAPDTTAQTGIEVLYHYDTPPADMPAGFSVTPSFLLGRLVAVHDRASTTLTSFDGRGRTTQSASRIAKPGPASDTLATRYAPRWYQKSMAFDAADREIGASTGSAIAELQGQPEALTATTSAVTTEYTRRGTVKAVAGSHGALVASIDRAADGLLEEVVYGDKASTTTSFAYDNRRRLSTVQTYRGPPAEWTSPPADYQPPPSFSLDHLPTFQLLLQDDELAYDVVSNPIEIRDWRIASEWPSGAKPVTRKAKYDDLYRVRRVDHQYEGGDDAWVSPFEAENSGNPNFDDPRRADPSPHVAFDRRVLWQTFEYDWLGNTSQSDDDVRGFYDRSLGTVQNSSSKPYQLAAASNESFPQVGAQDRRGELSTTYDASGNLTHLDVERSGPCLPSAALCSQRFLYEWDEVGRLVRARRFDVDAAALGTPLDPNAPSAADLRFAYDASDQRVLKSAHDAAGQSRHTVYVFDTLELRRAAFVPAGAGDTPDYELTPLTEVPYLFANGVRLARVVYEPPSAVVPSIGAATMHVFFELGDHLGSTSVVLDKATGELVERSTFQAYGAAESDYRPERWKSFRADYRFTGKEEDIEVGLQYFGKRFYAPMLQRWVSADPLGIHGLAADPNVYAYVSGEVLKATDPVGLDSFKGEFGFKATKQERAIATQSGRRLLKAGAGAVLVYGVAPTVCAFLGCGYANAPGPSDKRYNAKTELQKNIDTATFAAAGGVVKLLGRSLKFVQLSGKAAVAAGMGTATRLAEAKGLLDQIIGHTYGRMVATGTTERLARLRVNQEATAVIRFLDGTGRTRTAVATANREVWKDLSKASQAGELGEVELLPFVNRRKDPTHPDIIAAQYAKKQGATETTFASTPTTCHGCQEELPTHVPDIKIETPRPKE